MTIGFSADPIGDGVGELKIFGVEVGVVLVEPGRIVQADNTRVMRKKITKECRNRLA
jgi:hypothetical protein